MDRTIKAELCTERSLTRRGFVVAAGASVAAAGLGTGRLFAANIAVPAKRLQALILTGGGDHDWQAVSAETRRLLTGSGRFDVKVCESPVGLTSRTLAGFDLVIVDRTAASVGEETEAAVSAFARSGKGVVLTQGAIGRSEKSPGGFRPVVSADALPDPVRFVEIAVGRPEHPIATGLPAKFRAAGSTCRGLTLPADADVIASVVADPAPGRSEPVAFAYRHGEGRVFCLALGHDAATLQQPEIATLLIRGSEWAATGAVAPAAASLTGPTPGAVKGLVITGGHDHDSAFYALFDGYKDLDWLPVDVSTSAFRRDLRGRYDVVVMYDFTRDMDDVCKKNLRDFVEAGKGVVVLHHALLNYQKWPWWYEEVVGGRYLLERVGYTPTSAVKLDQRMFVTPLGPHPVLAGVEPYQITDEAYKRMWFSDRIRPLLTTDHPASDRNLAWVGPHEKARVVAIQSGHGPSAFGHPTYRTLVYNAVLWAAGKTA